MRSMSALRTLFAATLSMLLFIVLSPSYALAQDFVDIAKYGIEVVLNKSGLSVDMQRFKEFLNSIGAVHMTEDINGFSRDACITTMLYNNTPVTIQFEFQRLTFRGGGPEYLAVRIQDLVNITEEVKAHYMLRCSVNLTYDVVAKKLREFGSGKLAFRG